MRKRSFLSDLKQAATVFFYPFLHLSNIILSDSLIELVRVRTKHTSTLGVDRFKVYDLGIFDRCIKVRNKFLPVKLINVCHSAIMLVPRQIFRNVLRHITIGKNFGHTFCLFVDQMILLLYRSDLH